MLGDDLALYFIQRPALELVSTSAGRRHTRCAPATVAAAAARAATAQIRPPIGPSAHALHVGIPKHLARV
jgi:hypothetical protein